MDKKQMEFSQLILEFLKWAGAIILASSPGIWALLSQKSKEKLEKKAKEAEASKVVIETTSAVQDIYQAMLADLKASFANQSEECKAKIIIVTERVEQLLVENTALREEVSELRKENKALKKSLDNLTIEVKKNGEK